MELMTVQILGIVIAAIILASQYWVDYKDSREDKLVILPAQKARLSRRLPRKRRF